MRGMGKFQAHLKVPPWSHSVIHGMQGLDLGRDTMVSLEVHGINCNLDLHLGHHLDLIVMMMEVLDHGNHFDGKNNIYSCLDNSIDVYGNFNDPY